MSADWITACNEFAFLVGFTAGIGFFSFLAWVIFGK